MKQKQQQQKEEEDEKVKRSKNPRKLQIIIMKKEKSFHPYNYTLKYLFVLYFGSIIIFHFHSLQ
jgi:hypothetical protein